MVTAKGIPQKVFVLLHEAAKAPHRTWPGLHVPNTASTANERSECRSAIVAIAVPDLHQLAGHGGHCLLHLSNIAL